MKMAFVNVLKVCCLTLAHHDEICVDEKFATLMEGILLHKAMGYFYRTSGVSNRRRTNCGRVRGHAEVNRGIGEVSVSRCMHSEN